VYTIDLEIGPPVGRREHITCLTLIPERRETPFVAISFIRTTSMASYCTNIVPEHKIASVAKAGGS
jgi:hypothetical protein